MTIQKQIIGINFTQGVDTKTNPKLVQGKLIELVNGEVSNGEIVKSPGYVALAKSQTVSSSATAPKTLVPFDENLLVVDNGQIYLYDETSDSLISKAQFPYVQQKTYNIQANFGSMQNTFAPISAAYDTFFAEIHYNPTSTKYELNVFDTEQQVNILYIDDFFNVAAYGALTGLKPVELVCGQIGIFIYSIDSLGAISEDIILYSSFARSTTLSVITGVVNYVPASDVSYYHVMDARYFDGKIWLAYRIGTTTNAVLYITIRSQYAATIRTLASISTVVDLTANIVNNNLSTEMKSINNVDSFIINYANQFFIYNVTNETQTFTFSYLGGEIYQTFSVSYLPSTGEIITLKHSFAETTTVPNPIPPVINRYKLGSGWTVIGNTPDARFSNKQWGNCWLAGGLYCTQDKIFFPVLYFSYIADGTTVATPVQERRATLFLMDSNYIVASSIVPLVAAVYNVPTTGPTKAPFASRAKHNVTVNTIAYPFFNEARVSINNNDYTFAFQLQAYEFTDVNTQSFSAWPRGKSTYIGLSQMFEYSAYGFYEQNFYDYPQISIKGVNTGGASLVAGNAYAYQAIYEWINGEGELVRSAPSIAKTDTLGGGLNSYDVYYTIPPFFTNRKNQKIKIYRTSANGTLFQLVKTIDQATTNPPYTTGGSYFVFNDGVSDASIAQNEIIYTSGNVLGAFPYYASNGFVLHNNRIFSIVANDPNTIQYSKPYNIGVALEASPFLTFPIEPRGGDCIQLASLDDKLIVFKRDYIYAILGDGADATGNNLTLSKPELINSPVGCSEPLSVVRTPVGIMFKSRKGIYLLDRSLTVSYIGADVEKYNSNKITSASLLQTVNKVKFTTDSGVILIYDYYYNTWSTEDNFTIASASLYQGEFTLITTDGKILKQTPNVYTRDNNNYKFKMRTGWLKLNGLQNYQRIYRILFLGDYKGAHLLRVGILYDYVDAVQEFKYFDPNNNLGIANSFGEGNFGSVVPYGGLDSSVYQFRINPGKQKCEAIQLVIEDYFENSIFETGNSFTITDMTFVIGIKGTEFKVPVNVRV